MQTAQKGRSWRSAAKAHKKAKDLGPLGAVEPEFRRAHDNSPKVGPGQVYVTRQGEVFHPAWCLTVGTVWDRNPGGLLVIAETVVGDRRRCEACNEPLQA